MDRGDDGVFTIYGIASAAYLAVAAVYLVMLRMPIAKVGRPARVSSATPTADEPAVVNRTVLVGTAGVVLIVIGIQLNTVTVPLLIVSTINGTLTDLGIFAGLAAALEVPFMVLWGFALKRMGKHTIIVIAALLYAVYLTLLGRAESIEAILWLQLINGPATAGLMSVPISYMQDAVKGRVGLSTSLLDVVNVVAGLACALTFGMMTAATKDYRLVFVAAAGLSLGVAAVLSAAHWLMRSRPLPLEER